MKDRPDTISDINFCQCSTYAMHDPIFSVIYFTVDVMSDFGKIRDMCIATHLHVLVYRSSVVATTNDSMPPHIQPK